MNLPNEINQRILDELAAPSDKSATRVVVLSTSNAGPFRLTGRKRKYVLSRDNIAGAHVLDVPDSLWQHDIPLDAPYRSNLSIAHDLAGNTVSLIFLRVPYGPQDTAAEVAADEFAPIPEAGITGRVVLAYLKEIGAPDPVRERIEQIIADPETFRAYLDPAEDDIDADIDADTLGDAEKSEETSKGEPATGIIANATADTRSGPGPAPTSESPGAIRMREQRAAKAAAKAEAKRLAESGQPA